jgi:hypothetical protein
MAGARLSRPKIPVTVIPFLLLILFIFRYQKGTIDNSYIRTHEWKELEGFTIGGWLSFEKGDYYGLRNDTLFADHKAVAVVVQLDRAVLYGSTELHIRSIGTGKLGSYIEK